MSDILTFPAGLDRMAVAMPRHARPLVPAALAVLAHGALILLLFDLTLRPLPPAPEQAGFPMVLEAPAPAPPAAPIPQAAPLPPPPPTLVVRSVPAAPAPARPNPPRRAAPARLPEAARMPAAPADPPPQAAAPPDSVPEDGTAILEARIDAAVREAASMPEAARRQHRQGSARLRFTYRDGAVDGLQLVASSNSRLLDDAAMRAVRSAHYPAPPASMRGRTLNLLVWIDFRLTPTPG